MSSEPFTFEGRTTVCLKMSMASIPILEYALGLIGHPVGKAQTTSGERGRLSTASKDTGGVRKSCLYWCNKQRGKGRINFGGILGC